MPAFFRKRRPLRVPIALNVILMSLNIALMVVWIVLLAKYKSWSGLAIGTIFFSLILVGLSFYLVITIKEVRLNQRQSNFVDSVTHELKTPIASLKLYLETLQLRKLDEQQRHDFYAVMERELQRLDLLINQFLEVGRLNVIGQDTEPEDVDLPELLRHCAELACNHQRCNLEEVFQFDFEPAVIHERRIMLEMLFVNLIDNAIKYGGEPPRVEISVRTNSRGHVITKIRDNGEGVPPEIRKKIFRMFYRGGSELERRRKGTGLGLYIARTLTHSLKGSISVSDNDKAPGSLFEVDLPGKVKRT
ncbi:MAG: HAMP domain-containing sensor histidine kinase [Planctomycetaceae bacterium]